MCDPIPFVRIVDGKYVVPKEAEEFWSNIKDEIAIVVVVGKYRTGKSFLMNRCLLGDQGGGFSVGSTINSCTKGIWVYPKIIEAGIGRNKRKVVVMDSEGIGALDTDSTHDTKIFALSLLLSSQFVYNSMGSIDETALDTLSLVLKISNQVRVSASDEDTTTTTLASYMPRFKWVVRDFVLKLENESGTKITSNQYLENALAQTHDQQKNIIRNAIRDCFSDRSCTTMVRPCTDEDKLQELDSLPLEDMRPNFIAQLKQLQHELIYEAPPKRIMGHSVSGKMLVSLAKSFCEAINKGAAPVIKNSWVLMCEIKDRDLFDDCLKEFDEITSTWGDSAISVLSMQTAISDLITETLNRFKKSRAAEANATGDILNRLDATLQQRAEIIVNSVRGNITRIVATYIHELDLFVKSIGQDEITWSSVKDRICWVENDLSDRTGQGCDEAISLFRSNVLCSVLTWAGIALLASEQRSDKARYRGEEMCKKLSLALEERDEERERVQELSRRMANTDEAIETLKHSHSRQIEELEKELEVNINKMQKIDKETINEKDELIRTWIGKCQTARVDLDAEVRRAIDLENEIQTLQRRVMTTEETVQALRCTNPDLDEIRKNEILTQQNQALIDTIQELQNNIEYINTEIERLHSENKTSITELRLHSKRTLEEQSKSFSQIQQGLENRLKEAEHRLAFEERNLRELESKYKDAETEHVELIKRQKEQQLHTSEVLDIERSRNKDIIDQLDVLREEYKQLSNTNAIQQRAIAIEHQSEINKLYERIMLLEAESHEVLRRREGDLKQCEERIKHNKRQYEEVTTELQELKKYKLEHDQVQRNLTKISAENDHLKLDKCERTQRLNEYKLKAAELEKEKTSLERKLLVAEFKTAV